MTARVGSVLALPYAAGAFDAVWCAATLQYLTDDELAAALAEFRRVVRPGGLVALKDDDATVPRVLPAPANCLIHYYEAVARGGVTQYRGARRTPALGAWLRRAGLADIRAWTTLVERAAPLAPPERQCWDDLLASFAPVALRHELPAEDRALWARLVDPAGRACSTIRTSPAARGMSRRSGGSRRAAPHRPRRPASATGHGGTCRSGRREWRGRPRGRANDESEAP